MSASRPFGREQAKCFARLVSASSVLGASCAQRQEVRGTNDRVDRLELEQRVDKMEVRLDRRIDALHSELSSQLTGLRKDVVESEVRTATAIHDMHGTLRDVRDLLKGRLDLSDRVDRCERDIAELKQRVS